MKKVVFSVEKSNRNIYVSFRVTPEERGLISAKMELAGIRNLRAYMLKMALDGYVIQLNLTEVNEMVSLLSNVSNNLNQITRRANETRNIYEADIKELQGHYDRLWEQARNVLKQLSKL
jgi:hypothetical protein